VTTINTSTTTASSSKTIPLTSAVQAKQDIHPLEKVLIQSHVESILLIDRAMARRSAPQQQALKRKLKLDEEDHKQRKKLISMQSGTTNNATAPLNTGKKISIPTGGGTLSNTRSSSSSFALLEKEATFDKKKDAKRKKAQRLLDLARKLKKHADRKQKKK